jgi:hypothetical protein
MSHPHPFSVRRATPADAAAVLGCLRAAFEPYRVTSVSAALARSNRRPTK